MAAVAAAGCGALGQVAASPGDLADYRSFTMAAREGPRLARAQRYLQRHPDGHWAEEVRRTFDREESGLVRRRTIVSFASAGLP